MKKAFAALAVLSFSSLACGNSPLFNHATASRTTANPPTDRGSAPQGDCPLAFPKSGLCASITWDSALTSDAENTATLRFWDSNTGSEAGPYRNIDADGEAAVALWMPAMGHGSSPVTVTAQGGGVYSVTKAYFIMPGAWDVRVQIKKNHQLFEQAVASVNL
jgi:hypothetical protein